MYDKLTSTELAAHADADRHILATDKISPDNDTDSKRSIGTDKATNPESWPVIEAQPSRGRKEEQAAERRNLQLPSLRKNCPIKLAPTIFSWNLCS